LIDGSTEVESLALKYFDIRIFAAPATLSLYALHGWFLGVQNSKYPLYVSLFVNILNIILNLTFVYGFEMNVEGVALGTVISQYLGVFLSVFLLYKYYKKYISEFSYRIIIQKEKIKKFFKVNLDIFLRTLLLIFTISFFTAKSAEFNDEILAANFILLQLWLIVAYGVDGFAFAAESLVGRFKGAQDSFNLKKVIKYSFQWGIGLGIIVSLVYLFFNKQILALYTNQNNVIQIAQNFIIWIVIAPVINSISFIWDGIYIGATATREMLISMAVSTLIFFLPIYFITNDILGNHSIWLALTMFMVIRGLTLTILSKRLTK
jgi:MATE family multidrug resistance protein